MNFNLIRPCKKCPFRTDCLAGWLGEARATEIFDGITDQQKTFTCHETTTMDDDDDGQEEHCAGALILLEKLEQPNQLMRWMEQLGGYDRQKLKIDSPVFETGEKFIEHHSK